MTAALSLDTRTLVIVLMGVSFIGSIAMLLVWSTQKTYPGFGLWAAGNAAAAVGFTLIILRGILPDLLTIVLANGLFLASPLCYFEGTRRFRGAGNYRAFSAVAILVMLLAMSYFRFVEDHISIRIVIVSVVIGTVYGLTAWEFLRPLPFVLRRTRWSLSILFASYSLFLLIRACIVSTHMDPHDLFTPNTIGTGTFLLPILLGMSWTLGFIILNSQRMEFDLKNAHKELQQIAMTDFLTGLVNNRHFFETGEREIQRARRYNHSLSVLMLDIDYFKSVNDTHGHAGGDEVLKAIAVISKALLRETDTCGRLGGEEFAVLLPETDIEGAWAMAERLRSAIANTPMTAGHATVKITISVGVAQSLPVDACLEVTLRRADKALYEAKAAGRNCSVTASSAGLDPGGTPPLS